MPYMPAKILRFKPIRQFASGFFGKKKVNVEKSVTIPELKKNYQKNSTMSAES